MKPLRGHIVPSIVGGARREHTAIFLLVCTLATAGGGFAWARADDRRKVGGAIAREAAATQTGGASRTTVGGQEKRALGTGSRPTAQDESSFAAVTPDVLMAFRSVVQAARDGYSFVPTELPTDCRLVLRSPRSGDPGEPERTGPSVVLAAREGYLAFYDAMPGDLTHLPGAACGSVEGHAATVYRVLGGELVQWEVDGIRHGVFGWRMSRAVVVHVAAGMRRVSAGEKGQLSEPPDLLNSHSRSAGIVLESVHGSERKLSALTGLDRWVILNGPERMQILRGCRSPERMQISSDSPSSRWRARRY